MRRILRIFPLFFFSLVLGIFILPIFLKLFDIRDVQEHILYYCFFLNNFDIIYSGLSDFDNGILGGLWSIAIEEQFYLFWPVILFFIPNKNIFFLIITLLIGSLLFRIINIDNGLLLYYHTLSVMSDLLIGAMFAYFVLHNYKIIEFVKKMPISIICSVYLCMFCYLILNPNIIQIHFFKIIDRIVLALFFVFILLEQVFSSRSFLKVGNIPGFNYLGKISYGLYIFQFIPIMIVQKFNDVYVIDYKHSLVIYLLEFIAALLLNIFIAILSYRYFESWFLKMKNGYK